MGGFSIFWISSVLPFLKLILGIGPIVFPKPQISQLEILKLLTSSFLLLIILLFQAVRELKKPTNSSYSTSRRKLVPIVFIMMMSVPFVFGFVYEQDLQSLGQMILNMVGIDEDFNDIPPGTDPPGWEEDKGNWEVIDDGGELVYYQSNDRIKEAFTMPTTGNTSWTDYTFTVDLKFDEGPTNKPDRGAILVYRYSGGNDYYYLALREARDELEVYKHGPPGSGHLVGIASCTLVQDTWYSVNITIISNNVWISIDNTPYFTNLNMQGTHFSGSVGIGTEYYKVMFDNIQVDLIE
jgi:hypothetical protein